MFQRASFPTTMLYLPMPTRWQCSTVCRMIKSANSKLLQDTQSHPGDVWMSGTQIFYSLPESKGGM